jgi:hypothetical protein
MERGVCRRKADPDVGVVDIAPASPLYYFWGGDIGLELVREICELALS